MTESIPAAARNPWIVGGLIALLCLIWGSTWIAIKWGLHDLPPFTGASLRFGLAWLVMAAMAPRLSRLEGGAKPSWKLVFATGLGQFGISYAIVYWTSQSLPSGLVSVLWSVFPLFVAALAWLFLPNERLGRRQWLGFVVAFGGVALLFSTDVRAVGPDAVPVGLVLLCSPLISALSTIYLKRHGAGVSSALLNRDSAIVGTVTLTICALVTERDAEFAWTWQTWASIVYLALIGTCVSFGVYLWLMRYVPAYRLSLIAYVTPAIALLLGALLGDEPVGVNTILGTAVISVGVACGGRRRR